MKSASRLLLSLTHFHSISIILIVISIWLQNEAQSSIFCAHWIRIIYSIIHYIHAVINHFTSLNPKPTLAMDMLVCLFKIGPIQMTISQSTNVGCIFDCIQNRAKVELLLMSRYLVTLLDVYVWNKFNQNSDANRSELWCFRTEESNKAFTAVRRIISSGVLAVKTL